MNPTDPPLSDDELHAFVDGQLDAEQVPRLMAWLQAHPADAQRVTQWQVQRLKLRQAARDQDVGETPAALTAVVLGAGARTQRPGAWRQAVAAACLLVLGVAGVRLWGPAHLPAAVPAMAASPSFVHEAGLAHAVYTPEKRHAVEVAASDEAHLVQWLSRRLGAPLKAPSLVDRGWHLLGGRLLPGETAPRAQFMYENAQGGRMTLFIAAFAPGKAPAETSFRSVREGARESFYWVEGSFGYALSAELPPADVQALARDVYAQLTR